MANAALILNLLVVALLLFANAFFVATEFALVSVRKTRLAQLSKEGNKLAKIALDSSLCRCGKI